MSLIAPIITFSRHGDNIDMKPLKYFVDFCRTDYDSTVFTGTEG
jgi:hypothetical protein